MRLKKSVKRAIKVIVVTVFSLSLGIHYIWYTSDLEVRKQQNVSIVEFQEAVGMDIAYFSQLESLVFPPVTKDVYFTNYHLGDGSSGTTTASGKKISDFQVNEEGMYTYQGKVVIATANTTRLKWELKEGYSSHELYEEFIIRLNGKEYVGVVLDVCGSCYGVIGESIQRYDIFAVGNVIGKVVGQIVQERHSDQK